MTIRRIWGHRESPQAGPECRAQRLMQELLPRWAGGGGQKPGAKSLVHTEMVPSPISRSQRVLSVHLSGQPASPMALPCILKHDGTMLCDQVNGIRGCGRDTQCSSSTVFTGPALWKLSAVNYFTSRQILGLLRQSPQRYHYTSFMYCVLSLCQALYKQR